MQLAKNQVVVFANGKREGYLEARWSERHQAFYSFDEDGQKIYSTDVQDLPIRKGIKKFMPSADACTVRIYPCGETKDAYILEDGSNGKITRGNCRAYYRYVAKSICYQNNSGEIFAPVWA